MKVLITGASGVIGKHLIKHGLKNKWDITIFSYSGKLKKLPIKIYKWNPETLIKDNQLPKELCLVVKNVDIIINLSGESIANGRLNTQLKEKVLTSRLNATKALIALVKQSKSFNKTWIQMSATGFYKQDKTKTIDETSEAGETFLSKVCIETERLFNEAIRPMLKKSIILRLGLVLAKDAPAWKKISLPIRLGIGSALGSGTQFWSWIHIEDVIQAIQFLIFNTASTGVYNLTAPKPETQLSFTKKVAKVYSRPVIFPAVPSWALRLVVGDAIDELILASHKVVPKKLEQRGQKK